MEAEVEFTRAAPGEALAAPISQLQVFWFGWRKDIYYDNSHFKRALCHQEAWMEISLPCMSGLFLSCCSSSCWKMPSLPQGALEQSFGESSGFGTLESGENSTIHSSCEHSSGAVLQCLHSPALLHSRVSLGRTQSNRELGASAPHPSPPHLHPIPSPHPPHSESGQTQRFSRGQGKTYFW